MEVRLIGKDDLLQSKKLSSVAFEFGIDLVADNENVLGRMYGMFDDGRLISQMEVIPHEIYFDGHIVKSGGIAAVSTLPEFRHHKSVRKIFEAVFEQMKADDQYISQLYPFNFAYYNKFGYETAHERLSLKFNFNAIKHIERNNSCKYIEDHKNTDLRDLYEKYASQHNGAYKRNDALWEKILSDNIYKKRHYPYIYYNNNNQPTGYFIFTPDNGAHDFLLTELVYDTPDDLTGMLGFIRNFEANYSFIATNNLPSSEDFTLMFPDQYGVERSYKFASMSCIADVKKVFEIMKYPLDTGVFSIEVNDGFQPRNSGVYRISYADGKALEVEQKQSGSADITVSAKTLVKLVFGTDAMFSYRFRFLDDLKIHGNFDTLQKVFVKKSVYLGDHF